jgi:tetratricopeptide (TPR) repeat protein
MFYPNKMILIIFFLTLNFAFAKEANYPPEVKSSIANILKHFESGKYNETIVELNNLDQRIFTKKYKSNQLRGMLAYWRAITYKRINEFPQALDNFRLAIKYKYEAKDLYYEYAQALYTSEQMQKALRAFKVSAVNQKFKPAVSWYYIGFIHQSLKDYKHAIDAYKKVTTTKDPDKKAILQPAMMQLGDIYYLLAKQRIRAVETIEKLVLPQYRKAMQINPTSRLGFEIKARIHEIQRIYDIMMFKMRNGRPSIYQPFFTRFAQGISKDSNVTFAPDDSSSISQSDSASMISNTEFMAKYSFFHRNIISMAPEIRASYGYHLNRDESEIYSNDNYAINFAIRNAYEYTSKSNRPASFLFDYEYNYLSRDFSGTESIEFYNSSHTLMFGKRLSLSTFGESIFRYKYKMTTNHDNANNSNTHTLAYEQVIGIGLRKTLLFTSSLNLLRSDTESNSRNSLTARVDFILGSWGMIGTPSLALAGTFTDTMKQSEIRGNEVSINPSIKLGKKIGKKSRLIFNYGYTKNMSDSDDYTFSKSVFGVDYEYVF